MSAWKNFRWFLLILFFAFFGLWWLFVGLKFHADYGAFNRGQNAAWLGHRWVGQASSDEEIQELVSTLTRNEINTVFLHTGPFLSDGTLNNENHIFARDFLERARSYNPEIEYQSWLGQIRAKIDLDDQSVRNNIVKELEELIYVTGFDGIHFDIEPVWDEDLAFINLLEVTRKTLPETKISVALAEFIPRSLVWAAKGWKNFQNYNTEINYRNVARYADQVVVMTYDTSFSEEKWYSWLVQEQTVWVTRLLSDEVEVFIGLPTYEDFTEAFNPHVENIRSGIIGVHDGLRDIRSNKHNFAGIAIYSYWETQSDEWEDWQQLWLGR